MRRFALGAHPEDDGPHLPERVGVIAEGTCLSGAPEGVILRIEIEDDRMASQIPKPHRDTVLVRPLEVRGHRAGFEQIGHGGPARVIRRI
jgi:hypothetical protein